MKTPIDRLNVPAADLAESAHKWLLKPGRRLGYMTARVDESDRVVIDTLLLDTRAGSQTLMSAPLGSGQLEYPSLTRHVPAAHWAERRIGDFFGIQAAGHPRWKSLILHDDVWPLDQAPLASKPGRPREPYAFLTVEGEGIHEIPVGPIHAGIIEPGHFRFSCAGEVIAYLTIRLGYQHRGIEKRLAEVPWQRARFLAESAASDTAVGNALAHATALEQLIGIEAPPRSQHLRTIGLELERVANHIGDLGALCGDIGFSAGASLFAPLRGAVLGLAELVTGSRLQRYYVLPGGVSRDLPDGSRRKLGKALIQVRGRLAELVPLMLDNPAVLERMEGTGHLAASFCRDFGVVGPAARASGSSYDVRHVFPHGLFPPRAPVVATRVGGDALCRAQVRADEAFASLDLLAELVDDLPDGSIALPCVKERLAPDSVGIGIVEAWRGELIHWVTTRSDGSIARYAIKDPSFSNWTGLGVAVRGNLVPDFPLCNKSFNLSYSGNDL
ncbi:MAG: NADH-quinone oxidoreductase subunit C [Fimbriimonadales bacterium]